MKLKKADREFLATFVAVAQKMLDSTDKSSTGTNGAKPRKRRSAADLAVLKRQIRAARNRNMSVKTVADQLGVTPSYISAGQA